MEKLIEKAAVLFETFAEYGMDAKLENGERSPNAILCENTAKELRVLAEAAEPHVRPFVKSDAWLREKARVRENVTDKVIALAAGFMSESNHTLFAGAIQALEPLASPARVAEGEEAIPMEVERALKNEAAFHCLLHHCQRALSMPGPHSFDEELSKGVEAAIAISHGERSMSLHFNNDWLRKTTEADPDVDIEAGHDISEGHSAPEAPAAKGSR
jgi:hypothetical protein